MTRRLFSAIFLVLALTGSAVAQPVDRSAFEDRLAELRSQINADEALLAQTHSRTTTSRQSLSRIERDIAVREELVAAYEERLARLSVERDTLYARILNLEAQVQRLKDDYRARATRAYKYGRLSDLASVLSSSSVNQMLTRAKWLGRFAQTRKRRVGDIEDATSALSSQRDELQAMLDQTTETLQHARREGEELADQRRRRQQVIEELRSTASRLSRQLETRQEAARDLQNRIAALIAEERRAAAAAAGFDAEAFDALTGSFADNRGRLPWPARGTLVEPFGDVVDPVYRTRTTNQGAVVATAAGAAVRAVFDGRVIMVDVMPEYGTYVVVAHGDYATLYANLSSVGVTTNDFLRAGDPVGRAGTAAEPRGAGYVFGLVDRDGRFVDPAPWLRRP